MKVLFEAKARIKQQMVLYNIFRLQPEKYKAVIALKANTDNDQAAPSEVVLIKKNGAWQTEDNTNAVLAGTLGIEIDVFNNGYGDLLGRIGVR